MALDYLVYVGTYTNTGSEGIYTCRLDMSSGSLRNCTLAAATENPSFLAVHPSRRYLYAVNETARFRGESSGAVSAFVIEPDTGGLSFLNQQATRGSSPCYVSVEKSGRYVLLANYGGGSVAALPVLADGGLGEASDFVQHEGSSVNVRRQKGPHAHSIITDPTGRFAFVCDLGIDKILVYRLDLDNGKLHAHGVPCIRVRAGAGPRHLTFEPGGRFAYLINELDSTITAFAYDPGSGTLTELQTVSALPDGFEGQSYCADIHVHPAGSFVCGSNRGDDSIVIYRIDEGSGKLSYVGHQTTQGEIPRNFVLDPTGTFLFAANQESDSIVTFRIDQETGALRPTGDVLHVPSPVCIKIVHLS